MKVIGHTKQESRIICVIFLNVPASSNLLSLELLYFVSTCKACVLLRIQRRDGSKHTFNLPRDLTEGKMGAGDWKKIRGETNVSKLRKVFVSFPDKPSLVLKRSIIIMRLKNPPKASLGTEEKLRWVIFHLCFTPGLHTEVTLKIGYFRGRKKQGPDSRP